MTERSRQPTSVQIMVFALPAVSTAMVFVPIFAILPLLYAEHTQATTATIGALLMLSRVFDTITDPLIGWLSDRTQSRFGRRKPWIVCGAVLCAAGVWFLFTPDPEAGGGYYFASSLVATLGWTMIGVPMAAWGAEITDDYHLRTRVYAFRTVAGVIGTMLFLALPYAYFFETTEITLDVLRLAAAIIGPLLLVSVAAAVVVCPEGPPPAAPPVSPWRDVTAVVRNGPFRRFALALIIVASGAGATVTATYAFINDYLGLAERYSQILLILLPVGLLAVPLWTRIMRVTGKHRAWAAGGMFSALIGPLLYFVPPGEAAFWPYLTITFCQAMAIFASTVAAPSMLADIIDYDELQTGRNRSGTYFAAFSLVQKAAVALTSGLGLVILGLTGYTPGGENSTLSINALIFTVAVVPGLFYMTAFYLIWKFPIDEARQRSIREQIERLREQPV